MDKKPVSAAGLNKTAKKQPRRYWDGTADNFLTELTSNIEISTFSEKEFQHRMLAYLQKS